MGVKEFAHYYNKYNTTQMINYDIRFLKKLNNLWMKYHRTEKLSYIFEIINILKMLSNYMCIEECSKEIIEYVDDEYKEDTKKMIENIEELNLDTLRNLGIL